MGFELNEVCRYLREVLTFRNYIEIPDDNESYFLISEQELKTGILENKDNRSKLSELWASKEEGRGIEPFVEVVLIPKIVSDIIPKYTSPKVKDNTRLWEYKRVSLFYLKAIIDRETLHIKCKPGESVVWADPLIKKCPNRYVVVFYRLLNKIFHQNKKRKNIKFCLKDAPTMNCSNHNWTQYIEEVNNHFERRSGISLWNSFTLKDEYGTDHTLHIEKDIANTIVLKDNTVFAAMHLVKLLTDIENASDIRLPLYEKMVFGNPGKKITYSHKCGERIETHLGQMKDNFPLATAQREVIHAFAQMREGDVLAVSGPPGTGKTTMLQSVVADMVVKQTILSKRENVKDSSPFILASSANNKAITNIIDAFRDDETDTGVADIFHRWLCYSIDEEERFVPMAVYCPSATAGRKKGNVYFITDVVGRGNYGSLRERYYKDSSDFYMRASKSLGIKIENANELSEILWQQIEQLYEELNGIGKTLKRLTTSMYDLKGIANDLVCRYEGRPSQNGLNKMVDRLKNVRTKKDAASVFDEILDMTLRFHLYWLSVHYNECEWIKRIEKYREREGGLRKVYGKYLWDEIKYISPCVVSTFYMAPKLFEYTCRDGCKSYNYRLADLLIVDEAGQVSPEIGLPVFALAKEALVVGDVKQIPPVYSIPDSAENTYWTQCIYSRRLREEHEILSCVSSSIMAIAESRCKYERINGIGKKAPGLFLNEHRRCVNEIIAYSNELIYNGELTPKRGHAEGICRLGSLPPIGFLSVEGVCETKDGSRFNRKEVEAISKWIKRNASIIEEAYSQHNKKKSINELISIITPFKAQSTLLKEDDYLRKIPSGTVHTFQGAESPIVIFSLVYGASDNPTFLKANHELMNVAVSRAKDHFIVIGNSSCLERNLSDKACNLLHKMSQNIGKM